MPAGSLRRNEMRGIELRGNTTRGNGLRVIMTQTLQPIPRGSDPAPLF